MPQTDNNETFLFVTPRSRSFDFIASRTPHLPSFLTFFDGSPYLVLLGGRLTVLGHCLEKYESSALFERQPPTRKIITFLIAYHQPLPPKLKLTEKSNFLFKNSSKLHKIEKFIQNIKLLQLWPRLLFFGVSLLFKDGTTMQRLKGKKCKQYINKYWNHWINC